MVDARRAEWRPLPLAELRAIFSAQPARWWVAGGHALELFAGRSWRAHGDVDAGIPRGDELALCRALRTEEVAPPEANSVWCRRAGEDEFRFEYLLERSERGAWTFRRDPRVRLPLAELVRRTADGCPYLRPDVQLLYKAKARRPKDEADFGEVAPLLDAAARSWLRAALERVEPGHDWLARL